MTEPGKIDPGKTDAAKTAPATPDTGKFGDIADLPFEKALAELELIVGRLERGEALKTRCEGLLKQAETRIERITLSADGRPTGTRPLDDN